MRASARRGAGREAPISHWRKALSADPLPTLLESGQPELEYLARRDLLDEDTGSPHRLWALPPVARLVRKQQPDGSWAYPGGGVETHRTVEDYGQIETYRNLGILVEKYAATRRLPAARQAAEFLYSRQTEAGDFRGIYGRQLTPNYSGGILELLIKAGYASDPRTRRGLRWLLTVRQSDGGWAIPMVTVGARWDPATLGGRLIPGDRRRPFSHMVTGVVLRAFAAHPRARLRPEVRAAGDLLASRLFLRDTYPGRDTPDFWTKFTYPFWFTDLLSALDTLSLLGIGREQPQVSRALDWLAERQEGDGTWQLQRLRAGGKDRAGPWLTLAVCRVFKRVGDQTRRGSHTGSGGRRSGTQDRQERG